MAPHTAGGARPYELFTAFLPGSSAPGPADTEWLEVSPTFRRDAVVLLGAVAAIGVATELLRAMVATSTTTVALVLLLIVLGTATFARLRVAVIAAAVSTLVFNFFFLQPVGTFAIADAENWIVLAVYLAVAVVASKLSASAQERARARLAETLLASLSHDMRTPLTTVRVAVDNLRRPLDETERAAQGAVAAAELERLTLLLENMLDMAQIDAGAVQVERQWVATADVVDAALAHVRHALAGHPVVVDATDDRQVQIDPRLTSAALSHLLENAARYSPGGGRIVIVGRVEGDGLHVSVTDQGPGLEPSEIDRVFDRWYRGTAGRRVAHGTGMGLTIARGLLATIGGRAWAENAPGAGARFSFSVPGPVRRTAASPS
jgi:K+-sensing histidine kinase KdpD